MKIDLKYVYYTSYKLLNKEKNKNKPFVFSFNKLSSLLCKKNNDLNIF